MNKLLPEDCFYFYTHDGGKIGPVTYEVLRHRAADGGLNPRLDMVWTQGMPEWKAAGEIEGLFERRTTPEAVEGTASPVSPTSASENESAEELMLKEQDWPGARRRSYLIATFIFPILWGIGFDAGSGLLTAQFGPEIMNVVILGAQFVPLLVLIYYGIRRLTNVGMSGWWLLGYLVPLLNFWVGYRCFACPGGYAFHKKMDGIGIFLAIIYWLLVLVVICAIAAFVALLSGSIGNPELQQQVQDVVRNLSDTLRELSKPKP